MVRFCLVNPLEYGLPRYRWLNMLYQIQPVFKRSWLSNFAQQGIHWHWPHGDFAFYFRKPSPRCSGAVHGGVTLQQIASKLGDHHARNKLYVTCFDAPYNTPWVSIIEGCHRQQALRPGLVPAVRIILPCTSLEVSHQTFFKRHVQTESEVLFRGCAVSVFVGGGQFCLMGTSAILFGVQANVKRNFGYRNTE